MVSSFMGGAAGSVVGQAVIEVVLDNSGINKSLTATQKMVAGLAVAGLGTATVQALAYETALAGVAKTTNLTGQPLQELGKEFRALATRDIPMSASQLANIGATAAQLGVQSEDLVGFTEAIAKLGTATNIVGEQGAQDLARFINVMGDSTKNVENIGSAIVDLGNNSATTEAEILALALRTAAAGRQMGLTTGDVLGLATAASSLGLEAEAGGTALSRVMLDIYANAQKGSHALALHARVAGMTAEAYHEMVQSSPMEALTAFIGGLGTAEERGIEVISMLDEMSFGNVRIRDTLLRLSGAQELVTASVQRGNNAYRENRALQEEFQIFAETGANKLRILVNQVTDLGLTLAGVLTPALSVTVSVMSTLVTGFASLSGELQIATMAFLAFLALQAPLGVLLSRSAAGVVKLGGNLAALFSLVRTNGLAAVKLIGPMGLAGALLAVGVAADVILQKTTGHGLIDWLFRDPRTADAAAQSLARFRAELEATNTELISPEGIAAANRAIERFAEDWKQTSDEIAANPLFGGNREGIPLKQTKAALVELVKALVDAGVPFATLQRLISGLEGELGEAARGAIPDYAVRLREAANATADAGAEAANAEQRLIAMAGAGYETEQSLNGVTSAAQRARDELRGMGMELAASNLLKQYGIAALNAGEAREAAVSDLVRAFYGDYASQKAVDDLIAEAMERLPRSGYSLATGRSVAHPSGDKTITDMELLLELFDAFGSRAPRAMREARAELDLYRAAAVKAGDAHTVGLIDRLKQTDPTVQDIRGAIGSLQAQYGDLARSAEESGRRQREAMDEARQAAIDNVDILGRAITTALERQHAAERDATLKHITERRGIYQVAHDERIGQIQRERDEAIAVIDAEIAALRRAGTDTRLADLRAELKREEWDPVARKRILDQIAEIERQITIDQLEEAKAVIQDEARTREDAAKDDLKRQEKLYDDQEKAARDTYADITEAWKLEARARELIAAGELDAITTLISQHVPEWVSLWQSFAEQVIDGPLADLRKAAAGSFAALGQGGGAAGGIGAAALNPNAAQIAALNALGASNKALGVPPFVLDNTRSQIRNLGGLPTFKDGGALYEPAIVLAGDRPGTFEHIVGDDQLRRSLRDEFDRGGRELVIHQTIVLDGEVIDRRTERAVATATGQAITRGGYGG